MRSQNDKSATDLEQVQGKAVLGDLWNQNTLEADRQLVQLILGRMKAQKGRKSGRAPGPGEGAQTSAPRRVEPSPGAHPLGNNMGCAKNTSGSESPEAKQVEPPRKVFVACDKLKGGLSIEWGTKFYDKVLPILEDCQQAALNGETPLAWFEVGLKTFRVAAYGTGTGKSRREFLLRCPDLDIVLKINRIQPEEGRKWNGSYEIGSVGCQIRTDEENLQLLHQLADALGGRLAVAGLGSADLRADFDLFTAQEFEQLWRADRIVCRARGFKSAGDKAGTQSFYLGSQGHKTPIYLRCYDKLAELEAKPNAIKQQLLKDQLGDVEKVTRLEFVMGRLFLREMEVKTLDDFIRLKSSIGRYITTEWMRIVDYKEANRQRSPVSDVWKILQAAFSQAGTYPATRVKRDRKRRGDKQHLLSMGMGCLVKALAGEAETYDQFTELVSEAVWQHVKAIGLEEFELKLAGLRANEPKHEVLFQPEGKLKRNPDEILQALNRLNLGRGTAEAMRERFERTQTDDAKERRAKWQESQLEFFDQQGKPQTFSLPQGWSDHEGEDDTSFCPSTWEPSSCLPEEAYF